MLHHPRSQLLRQQRHTPRSRRRTQHTRLQHRRSTLHRLLHSLRTHTSRSTNLTILNHNHAHQLQRLRHILTIPLPHTRMPSKPSRQSLQPSTRKPSQQHSLPTRRKYHNQHHKSIQQRPHSNRQLPLHAHHQLHLRNTQGQRRAHKDLVKSERFNTS